MTRQYYIYYLDQKLALQAGRSYSIGRSMDCDVSLPQGSVSRNHSRIDWDGNRFVIVDLGSTNGTFVNKDMIHEHPLMDGDKIKIGDFYLEFREHEESQDETAEDITDETLPPSETLLLEKKVAQIMDEVKDPDLAEKILDLKSSFVKKKKKLSELAYRDGLTGLFNRRYFDDRLKDEIARAKRYSRDLTLILTDIDHFKRFNDDFGHQKGDEVLILVGNIIKENSRQNDTVARYGGEEMAMILPETPLDMAAKVAEKLRTAVIMEAEKKAGVKITISLGVAGYNVDRDSVTALVKAADDALYLAKEKGRNRVEQAEP